MSAEILTNWDNKVIILHDIDVEIIVRKSLLVLIITFIQIGRGEGGREDEKSPTLLQDSITSAKR